MKFASLLTLAVLSLPCVADAQANSTAEDWYYFGPNNPVGMRRAPRPEYSERLQRLEGDLLVAEDELARLERELR